LTFAQAGLWAFPGEQPLTVDWSIGTSAFASDVSSAVSVPVSNTYWGQDPFDYYSIYESTFSLNGTLAAGTQYWLTLQNATSSGGHYVYWDENDGPSSANELDFGSIGSESFQLYAFGSAVPEPTGIVALSGIAGMGLIGLVWRRRRA
jgi:hypothetical protein